MHYMNLSTSSVKLDYTVSIDQLHRNIWIIALFYRNKRWTQISRLCHAYFSLSCGVSTRGLFERAKATDFPGEEIRLSLCLPGSVALTFAASLSLHPLCHTLCHLVKPPGRIHGMNTSWAGSCWEARGD